MKRRMKIPVTSPAASNRPRPIDSPDGRFVKIAIFACKFYFTPPQIKLGRRWFLHTLLGGHGSPQILTHRWRLT